MSQILCFLMTTIFSLPSTPFQGYPRRQATPVLTHHIIIQNIQNLLNPWDSTYHPSLIHTTYFQPQDWLLRTGTNIDGYENPIPMRHRGWNYALNIFVEALAASIQMASQAITPCTALQALLQAAVSLTQANADQIASLLINLPIPLINIDTRPYCRRYFASYSERRYVIARRPDEYPSITFNPLAVLRHLFGMPHRVDIYDIENAQHSLVLWNSWYWTVVDTGVWGPDEHQEQRGPGWV